MKKVKKIIASVIVSTFIFGGAVAVGIAEATPFQLPQYDDEYTYQNILGFTIIRDYANDNKIVGISF